MKPLTAVALALLAALPALAYPNIKINDDTTTQIQNEQQIVANPTDPDNVVAVWRDFRLGYRRVGAGASTDGGFSWSQQLLVDTHYQHHSDPGLTADRFGNFYAVILSFTGSTSEPNGLFVQKSTDGGFTWGPSVTVVNGVADVFEDKELIACDRSGGVCDGYLYVVWARFGWDMSAMVSRSTDGGASFQPPVELETDYLQWPVPAVGPDGELYVAWENLYDGIKIRRSTNGGASFGSTTVVDAQASFYGDVNGGVTVFSYPALDVDCSSGPHRGRVHVAYMVDAGSSGTDMYYRYSDSGGATWSSRVKLNDDPAGAGIDQFHPWLAVSPETGEVAVLWYDRRNDPANLLMDVYWSRSTDGGATWTTDERVTTVSSDPTAGSRTAAGAAGDRAGLIGEYNGLTAAGAGGWNLVWTDTREGNQDTYTAPVRSGSPTPTPTAASSATPNPTPTATAGPPSPTPTVPQTATPEPTPGGLGVDLVLPGHEFHPGDTFRLDASLFSGGEQLEGVPLFVILDVYGDYWFWPSWIAGQAGFDYQPVDVPAAGLELTVIEPFVWPAGAGTLAGVRFHGAMTSGDLGALLGTMDTETWGFGP